MKRNLNDVIVIGFALFAMFFGAGNVIFPPYLGLQSGKLWTLGFIFYFIADVGLAILAILAMIRHGSAETVIKCHIFLFVLCTVKRYKKDLPKN